MLASSPVSCSLPLIPMRRRLLRSQSLPAIHSRLLNLLSLLSLLSLLRRLSLLSLSRSRPLSL